MADIEANIASARGAVIDGTPEPVGYRDALRYMEARGYLRSSRYRDQRLRSDTAGLDPDVYEFVRVYQRHMENIGIPVIADVALAHRDFARWFVTGVTNAPRLRLPVGRSVSIIHAIRGRALTPVCWRVFHHVGREVAGKLGLDVEGGEGATPWLWVVEP